MLYLFRFIATKRIRLQVSSLFIKENTLSNLGSNCIGLLFVVYFNLLSYRITMYDFSDDCLLTYATDKFKYHRVSIFLSKFQRMSSSVHKSTLGRPITKKYILVWNFYQLFRFIIKLSFLIHIWMTQFFVCVRKKLRITRRCITYFCLATISSSFIFSFFIMADRS